MGSHTQPSPLTKGKKAARLVVIVQQGWTIKILREIGSIIEKACFLNPVEYYCLIKMTPSMLYCQILWDKRNNWRRESRQTKENAPMKENTCSSGMK